MILQTGMDGFYHLNPRKHGRRVQRPGSGSTNISALNFRLEQLFISGFATER